MPPPVPPPRRLDGVKEIWRYAEQVADREFTEWQVRYWLRRKRRPLKVRRIYPGGSVNCLIITDEETVRNFILFRL